MYGLVGVSEGGEPYPEVTVLTRAMKQDAVLSDVRAVKGFEKRGLVCPIVYPLRGLA